MLDGVQDLLKVKCYNCHSFSYYACKCPQKKRKENASTTDVEELSPQNNKRTNLMKTIDKLRKD